MTAARVRGNARRPDAQAFDEVRIATTPRFKTSGLSGSEWRISAHVEFWRNGRKVRDSSAFRDVETALAFAVAEYHRAIDDGDAWFSSEGDWCDQEGCSEIAESVFRVKARHCDSCGSQEETGQEARRQFCARHVRRGDCGIDDADANYVLLSGPGLAGERRNPDDESPAATVVVRPS